MSEENQGKEPEVAVCSFCGKEMTDEIITAGDLFIRGKIDGAFICSDCVIEAVNVLNEHKPRQRPVGLLQTGIKPSKIYEHLNQYIIDQDYAKRILSVAVYNHYKFLEYLSQENPPVELEKSNIIMAGPTGAGKTYLIKTLAKILDVPYAIADATSMTQAGYVGEDPENCIRLLLENANGDIERAQRGIIYIDEIDKLSRKGENLSITRDVGGEGVQQALLKIIEGSVVDVPPKGQRKHPTAECVRIDTSKILFIVGGSFEGIEKIIQKRQISGKTSMGFGGEIVNKKMGEYNDYILDVQVEDFKKFGMIPEILGRLPVICPLQQLTEEALIRILTEPKNALAKQYQELMKMDNIEITFDAEALKEIASKAMERKTGARALRGIMDKILLPHMFAIPDMENLAEVNITKESVVDGANPEFKFRDATEAA